MLRSRLFLTSGSDYETWGGRITTKVASLAVGGFDGPCRVLDKYASASGAVEPGKLAQRDERWRPSYLAVLSIGLALAGALFVLFVPMGSSVSTSTGSDETQVVVRERTRLIDTEGSSVFAVLALPVVVAASGTGLAIARRSRRTLAVTAALMWILILAGLFSVGVFFLPAAMAMAAAAYLRLS